MIDSTAFWIRCSLSASTWLVASSRMRIGALAEDGAGDVEALLLAAGELPAQAVERRVVALRLLQDELVAESALRAASSMAARGRVGRP
jgi:hypothetical protein